MALNSLVAALEPGRTHSRDPRMGNVDQCGVVEIPTQDSGREKVVAERSSLCKRFSVQLFKIIFKLRCLRGGCS
jgi:hypothetical protein